MAQSKCLLDLVASLHEKSHVQLQRKINKYLEVQTGSSEVFLIPALPQDEVHHTDKNPGLCVHVVSAREARKSPIRLQSDAFTSFPEVSSGAKTNSADGDAIIRLENLSPKQATFIEQNIILDQLKSFLGVKIKNEQLAKERKEAPDKVHVIACLTNKITGEDFTDQDEEIVRQCFRVTLPILMNALVYEEENRLKTQCQKLLRVATNLFTHLDDVTLLLRQIMSEARQLTQAERCSLFLVDHAQNELIAKVFDGDVVDPQEAEVVAHQESAEVRVPITHGVAGHVAKSGEMLNIRDAQNHPLFYRNIDQATGFTTRSILCFPIKNAGNVIGVAELCNKNVADQGVDGSHFTKFDEEIALAFSAYCGIAIIHSLMYKKVADAQHRSKLSNELMMYHMKHANMDEKCMEVTDEEVNRLTDQTIRSLEEEVHQDFCKFQFTPRIIPADETPAIVLAMAESLGLINRFRISKSVMARFILMVKRGYRDPPYHNWDHAFSVAHFCFLAVRNLRLVEKNVLSDLDVLSLFIACLCHDLDHRGTNNNFQLTSNSVLAALYSSEGSVMERHHFAQAMCILNTEGCNLLENLDEQDYMHVLDLLRDIILATDLAHHFRIKQDLTEMVASGFNPNDEQHKSLILSLLMTASDLSDQAKDWENSKETAELVYSEFFSQGDLEKAMGNKPVESMDRERAYIPTLQIEFLDGIALPVYRDLNILFPEASEPYRAVRHNRACWGRLHEALLKRGRNGRPGQVKDFFRDQSIEREVNSVARNTAINCE